LPHHKHISRLAAGLFLLAYLVFAPAPTTAQAPIRSPYYGINYINMEEAALIAAIDSGAGSARWEFGWRSHELSPGQWDWRASDWLIGPLNGSGFQVHALLHNPPAFHMDERGVPTNLDLPWDHPANGWGQFCFGFAERYGPEVASYEIWNEPDIQTYWRGTPEEYYLLMKTCYQAIKAADPTAPVIMGSMVLLIHPDFYDTVVELASTDPDALANNYYFDAVSLHAYASPELMITLPAQANKTLSRYGIPQKPIWVTEFGILHQGYGIVPDEPAWDRATEEEAAWYLLQSVSNAHAAGIERMMWYRWSDDEDIVSYGLLRDDLDQRPAYAALKHATNVIRDIVSAQRTVRGDVVITDMQRADGVRIVTAYTLSGQSAEVSIPARGNGGFLFNPLGEPQPIQPNTNGQYVFTLPEASNRDFSQPDNYSFGGPVYTLAE